MSEIASDIHPAATNLDTCPAAEFRAKLSSYNTFAPEVQNVDLFPFMNRAREEYPVFKAEDPVQYWIVSRYEDVDYVLHHPELFSSKKTMYPFGVEEVSIAFNMDPPEQTAYHGIMARALAVKKVAAMEPVITRHARARAAEVKDKGSCEFVEDFATPMVLNALLECCGLASDRLAEAFTWISRFYTSGLGQGDDPAMMDEFMRQYALANEYIAEIIAQRKGGDGTDPISEMTRGKIDGRPVTDDELLQMATFTVLSGVDTTATMMSNIIAWFLKNPEREQELRARPELYEPAVDEFLRYEHMLSNGRVVTQDTTLRGMELKEGDFLMMLFGATGRDPRVFDCPEEVRFDRSPNPHLGFGAGPHRCIGLNLAKAELKIGLKEWHDAIASYRVDPNDEVKRRRGPIAGVMHLPLLLGP